MTRSIIISWGQQHRTPTGEEVSQLRRPWVSHHTIVILITLKTVNKWWSDKIRRLQRMAENINVYSVSIIEHRTTIIKRNNWCSRNPLLNKLSNNPLRLRLRRHRIVWRWINNIILRIIGMVVKMPYAPMHHWSWIKMAHRLPLQPTFKQRPVLPHRNIAQVRGRILLALISGSDTTKSLIEIKVAKTVQVITMWQELQMVVLPRNLVQRAPRAR